MSPLDKNKKNETLIFFHIPKTGGTTINEVLKKQYKNHEFLQIEQAVNAIEGKLFRRENLDNLILKSESDKINLKCISGHLHFGVHELLTNRSQYFTLFREPKKRIISHYHHILRTRHNFLHEELTSKKYSLEDYVSSGVHSDAQNGLVRRLCGNFSEVSTFSNFRLVDSKDLLSAKENLLEYFPVYGFIEKFDESLLLFKKKFNWNNKIFYVKRRVEKNKPSDNKLPKSTEDIITKYNEFDIELYRFAISRFDQMLKEKNITKREIFLFRMMNVHLYKNFNFLGNKFRRLKNFLQLLLMNGFKETLI